MTLDSPDLQGAIGRLERDMRHVQEDVKRIRQIASTADVTVARDDDHGPAVPGVELPPEILVEGPDRLSSYLADKMELAEIVGEMGRGLVEEFRGDPTEIWVSIEDDDYDDASYIIFNVRAPTYDDAFMDRLDRVSDRFNDRFSNVTGWAAISTDHVPVT